MRTGYTVLRKLNSLGVTITNKGEEEKEIDRSLLKGTKAYIALRNILKSNEISRVAKECIYKTTVGPTVLHRCETE